MEIPEELKGMDWETYDVFLALVSPDKKGHIISIAALVEEELTLYLAGGAKPDRKMKNKKIGDKLKDLERKFGTSSVLQEEKSSVLEFVSSIIDIRNLTAHSYGVGFEEFKRLIKKHPTAIKLLLDCPNGLWVGVNEFKAKLKQL